jgi:hypothetical protein
MPKPFPVGAQARGSPHCVLERPDCAMMIGAIVAEWSLAEYNLSLMYSDLVCGPTLDGVPIGQGDWVAMETFDIVNHFGQRLKMLIAAAKRRGFDTPTVEQFSKLLKKMQDTGAKRIAAAHGRWVISDDFPDGLVWFRNAGAHCDALVYEYADFKESLDRITQAAVELQKFFSTILAPTLRKETIEFLKLAVARANASSSNA